MGGRECEPGAHAGLRSVRSSSASSQSKEEQVTVVTATSVTQRNTWRLQQFIPN